MSKLTARLWRYVRVAGVSAIAPVSSCTESHPPVEAVTESDSVAVVEAIPDDSIRYSRLTAEDYIEVAAELDIPVAAIRAVVSIEAGPTGEGFNPDSTAIINFDINMFHQACRRKGVNLNLYKTSHAEVFEAPDVKKHGSRQAAQYARLQAAMSIDTICALEGTFWGMFQIGGFNWELCGCNSVFEFVELMNYSEREQLELFAEFLRKRRLIGYIRDRQWAKFALRYNGPGYKKHGYDSKLARAFDRFSE